VRVQTGRPIREDGGEAPGELTRGRTADGGTVSKRKDKHAHLIEPTWGQSTGDGPPVTELMSEMAGGLSPFGEDHAFPLPPERLRYAHPTDRPNPSGRARD
jgi:hypothetical protein